MNVLLPKLEEVKRRESKVDLWDWGTPSSSLGGIVNEYNETGWIGDLNLDKVISLAIEEGASDIHITPERTIAFTINGDISIREEFPHPDAQTMFELLKKILTNVQYSEYVKTMDFEFAYVVKRGPYRHRRLRGKAGRTMDMEYLVFRTISDEIPSTESLSVESEIKDWVRSRDGLVLICGATGTGKSTTLASVLRDVQLTEPKKIITIEKPIEYEYPDDGPALVVQRSVGIDCVSFYDALTGALRESPDLILLGEVRDTEEVSELIRAAETGHLAISTMHTNSVATTINRIQSLFSGNERKRILSTLSDTLVGVCNQVLVKTIDGRGRFACRELLTIDNETRKLIAAGDAEGIRTYLFEHKKTMEYKLASAAISGRCTRDEARSKASRVADFDFAYSELKKKKK